MKLVEAGRDIIEGTSLITVVGKTDIHIENFKSIAEYDNDRLKLLTRTGFITVYGKNLEIKYYDTEEIAISGRLERIEL